MKSRTGVFSAILGTFGVFLLLACGGGGGGGSSNPPPVYTGIATAAALDNTLRAGQFAYAAAMPNVISIPINVVPLSLSQKRALSTPSYSVQSLIRGIWNRTAKPARTMINARPLDTYGGAEGGTLTITIDWGVWSNQTPYMTRITAVCSSFDDTQDGIANPIDGTMTITPDTWTVDGMPVYFVASFDLHMKAGPASGARMAGSLDYHQVADNDPRQVSTWNALLIDDNTGIEIWGNPLIQIDEDLDPSRALLTVSGRVYISSYGYVDVSSLTPFDHPSVETDLMPISGSVLLAGKDAPAITAIVTVSGTAPEVQVDIYRPEGVVTAQFSWNELILF